MRIGRAYWGRAMAAVLLAAGLAGCSKGGDPVRSQAIAMVGALLSGGDEADIGRTREPSRAELDRIRSALIGFSYGELPPVYMVPLADTGSYLHYQDAGGRGIVMYGGAVSRTLGLGDNLMAVRYAPDDPIAHRTPLSGWPREVVRSYQFRRRDLDEYAITVTCVLQAEARVMYEIVELQFPVTRVKERCRNAAREFENTYWADESGFIWASEQWLGPYLKPGTVEIVRPYGG